MGRRTFVEIFAGAGGLGLGTARAGAQPVLIVERDKDCVVSYAGGAMQAGHTTADRPLGIVCDDVRKINWPSWTACGHLLDPLAEQLDLLIGGPPCQPFSKGGKRLGAEDERNGIPTFLDALEALRPRAFILENVAQLWTNERYQEIREGLMARAAALGYAAHGALLNAADYGVPQHRRRMFVVGFLGVPTYGSDRWYATGREFTFPPRTHGDPLLIGPGGSLKPWVTVGEALDFAPQSDIPNESRVVYAKNPIYRPRLVDSLLVNGKGRVLDLGAPSPTIVAQSSGNGGHILDALALPESARVTYARKPFLNPSPFTGLLVNGGGRPLDPSRPSNTIAAGSGNRVPFLDPQGVLVEYHAELMAARERGEPLPVRSGDVPLVIRLSARQAARLQGFTDDYPFAGGPTSVFRQIGNAVPPPLAEAVGRAVLEYLDRLGVAS